MKLAMRLVGCVGMSVGLMASLAVATPPVLDRVPKNALVVVAVGDAQKLQKNITALSGAIDSPLPIPAIDDLLAQAGIGEGADTSKSMALVIMPPPNGGKDEQGKPLDQEALGAAMEKNMFILVPTTDYSKFIGNFQAKNEGGVDVGNMDGDEAYFKNVGGGYAAMSPLKTVIAGLDGAGGNQATFDASMGPSGRQVADNSDVFIMVNMAEARVFRPILMEQFAEQMEGNPMALAMEGAGGDGMGAFLDMVEKDVKTMIIGMKPDAMGAGLNVGMSFNEGSDMAKAFAGKGSANQLLTKLPNQPYFFAMAMDMSTPGVRALVNNFAQQMAGEEKDGLPALLLDQVKASDGAAIAICAPDGGLMGGMLTKTISYLRTSKPDNFVAAMREGMTTLNGQAVGPMSMDTAFKADGGEVDGVKVDSYSVKFKPVDEDEADPQIGMAMQMIFGTAGGPSGYIAKVDGGVLQTYSKNSLLMSAAMKSAKGGENLTSCLLYTSPSPRD